MEIVKQAITGNETAAGVSSPYAALVNFYAAFNNRNLELMKANWLQTEAASMSNPLGGIKRGWINICEVYNKIFNREAIVYVEFYDYSIHQAESMFIAVGHERGTLTMNNREINLAIRTSRIYRLHDGQWKQIHHHGSMDNPQLLNTYQSILLNKQQEQL